MYTSFIPSALSTPAALCPILGVLILFDNRSLSQFSGLAHYMLSKWLEGQAFVEQVGVVGRLALRRDRRRHRSQDQNQAQHRSSLRRSSISNPDEFDVGLGCMLNHFLPGSVVGSLYTKRIHSPHAFLCNPRSILCQQWQKPVMSGPYHYHPFWSRQLRGRGSVIRRCPMFILRFWLIVNLSKLKPGVGKAMRFPPLTRCIGASRDKRFPIPVKGYVSVGLRAVVVLPQVVHNHLPLRIRQIKQEMP